MSLETISLSDELTADRGSQSVVQPESRSDPARNATEVAANSSGYTLDTKGFEWPFQRALEWALLRPRSVRELDDYLRRKSWKTVEQVRAKLLERGYVDDAKFTRYFIENRRVRKGVSRKRLMLELRAKGITPELAEKVWQELAADGLTRNDREEIAKIIAKKRTKYDDQALVQYLVRQGFSYSDAAEAVATTPDLA